ncbi:MAG TPA: PIG-L deacetylase family protein [Chryseosolibacter sp.]|nr:PIG-L deacetylase family protein [Chryseosolibacter sp.]
MLPLKFSNATGLKLLFLGAHCDDIEIGCGGSILKIIKQYPVEHIQWVVFTSTPARRKEAERSAEYFLKGVKGKEIVVRDFSDGILPQQAGEVKSYFEMIKKAYDPDIVFTHYRQDLHQDHRLINELTWNTFRNHFILEYEIQKYDGDLGRPSFFVPIDEDTATCKVQAILEYFITQSTKHWFDQETFLALMRIRGLESATRYAEAFYMRKGIL